MVTTTTTAPTLAEILAQALARTTARRLQEEIAEIDAILRLVEPGDTAAWRCLMDHRRERQAAIEDLGWWA